MNSHRRKWRPTFIPGNGRLGPALSFTYVIGAVALERGVADDKRPRINVDGAALKTEVQRWMSHRPNWKTFCEKSELAL